MENKNKELLLNKIDELINLIKNSDDYKRYIYLKEQLSKNKNLMTLINKIKKKEQERVKKEYKKESVDDLEKDINKLKKELNSYPDYIEFSYLQSDINNELQNIKIIIEKTLKK